MLPLRRATRAALRELALEEVLAVVRASLARTRRGDGSAASAYRSLAAARERYEHPGGLDAVRDALWGWADVDAAATAGADHCGARRTAAVGQRRPAPHDDRTAAAGSGADRTSASPAGASRP